MNFSNDVSDLSISDHNPIRSITEIAQTRPKGRAYISFRSFKHFNQNSFFGGLICTPFDNVHMHAV